MNVFYINPDPVLAAKDLPDKLLVKMPLETAQLLCTTINLLGGTSPYKTTHKNHPSAIWARTNKENFLWLARHGKALCGVYSQVYGRTHKCLSIIEECETKATALPEEAFFEPPQCMPDQYRCDDTVRAYQRYMIAEKSYYAKWKNRQKPEWWII